MDTTRLYRAGKSYHFSAEPRPPPPCRIDSNEATAGQFSRSAFPDILVQANHDVVVVHPAASWNQRVCRISLIFALNRRIDSTTKSSVDSSGAARQISGDAKDSNIFDARHALMDWVQ